MEAVADIVDPRVSPSPVTFQYYIPERPLSEFVAVFCYWRGHDVPYSKERILPAGTADLVISIGPHSVAGISGPRSQSLVIERTTHDELLGIHFSTEEVRTWR